MSTRVFGLSLFLLSLVAAPVLAQNVSFVDAYGSSAERYSVAGRAHVRVEDPNAHVTVQVTVRSGRTGDQETLVLQETAGDGGIFEGSLPLQQFFFEGGPTPDDGRLESFPVDQIEAVYLTSSDQALIFHAAALFVDESGKPTGDVVEDGVARVRVLYPSTFFANETIDALVRSRDGADEEIVTLRETHPDSGVWEGEVQLVSSAPGGGIPDNDQLETSVADELTVSYHDGEGRAVTIPSRVQFLDRFGRVATTFAVGDRIGVRVESHGEDDPLARRTIQVQVREAGGGDSETVALTETGFDTNVYEGFFGTEGSPAVSGDGVLQADPGSVIEAEHQNETTPNPTVARATMSAASVLFVDADGLPAELYFEGTRAYVRVIDSFASGAVYAVVESMLGGDSESLSLMQTSPGVYEGSIELRSASAAPGNGLLEARQDSLRVSYGDPGDPVTYTVGTIGFRTWFVDAYGRPAESYSIAGPAYMRVEDHNAHGAVQVTVRSGSTGDQETLVLHETAGDGGIFEGSLPLALFFFEGGPTPDDGRLESYPVDQIEAVYLTSSDQALIFYASALFIDESGKPTGEVVEGGVARVRVLYPFYPEEGNTLYAFVRSRDGADEEMVTLTETLFGSGVWEGEVQLVSSAPGGGIPYNGQFETSLADELTVTHRDGEGRAVTIPSQVRFLDRFGRVAASFAVGDRVGVRVESHGQDDPLARRTIQVQVREAGGGDSETVDLTETGFDTDVYEGFFGTEGSPAVSGDGVLQADPGSVIEAEHQNETRPDPTVARATMSAASVLFVDADGLPAELYLEGARAYVRVIDTFASGAVYAVVESVLGGDSESLSLMQTSPGVYEGSIELRSASAAPGNGLLEVRQDSLRVSYGGPGDPVTDTVGTVGSRTWFMDAYGSPAESYSIAGRAHVRVEDHNAHGTVQVTVRSGFTGDQETLVLQETAGDGGIFEGSLPLALFLFEGGPTPDDGRLESHPVDQIEAVYLTSSDQALILYASALFIDEAGKPTSEVVEGGVARMRVLYPYFFGAETIDALVRSRDGADVESVTLREIHPDSGVWEGEVQLVSSAPGGGIPYSGQLETSVADELTVSYHDSEGRAVTILPPSNAAPTAENDTAMTLEDQAVNIAVLANDSDPDNDPLAVLQLEPPAHGSVTLEADGTVTYTPHPDFAGLDSFAYAAADPDGASSSATVTVTVTAVNDAPVAVDDSAATLAETPVTIQVLANDTDIDSAALLVTAVTQGAHGTVTLNPVTYTPAANYNGPDAFTYTISDGAGGTATATVSLDVQAPPRVSGDLQVLYTFDEGSGTTVHDVSGMGAPLDLTVGDPSAVTWLPGALSIHSDTLVESAQAAAKVVGASQASDEVTVEAWVVPSDLSQTGPAPIVTMSQNPNKRNVTLGQSGTAYNGQLRTTSTDKVGARTDAAGTASLGLTHVVYTRSSTGGVRIYVDGTEEASGTVAGTFAAWEGFNLALGGELAGPRYWTGEIHLVAIYGRALTSAEVRQNWLAGEN